MTLEQALKEARTIEKTNLISGKCKGKDLALWLTLINGLKG